MDIGESLQLCSSSFLGLFTAALREISTEKDTGVQHWIVFDGDIDPVWAENMNTLLDDSKLLSLPSGQFDVDV